MATARYWEAIFLFFFFFFFSFQFSLSASVNSSSRPISMSQGYLGTYGSSHTSKRQATDRLRKASFITHTRSCCI
ncbi:hypothetical protein QBC32DRAFT_348244 [Pseudoneurospora amorphoporcata]|uniref:Secreted protein n=1 Tax=Pseudoneurospora amorphoporcata TaxID=241081 RepID=A0AAN6NPT0_9PEZI|nr:hypothetical protein QBC32DRAFT_348244 [Pseudoneurospora amorphoporcata]